MSFEPNDKQALLLWQMLVADTPEEREPMKSKAKPDIGPKQRNVLVDHGFLEVEKRKGQRGEFLTLTNKAWEWASQASDVRIMKSQFAASALQNLLRRLVPYLQEHDMALAELLADAPSVHEPAASSKPEVNVPAPETPTNSCPPEKGPRLGSMPSPGDALWPEIERTCLDLAHGAKKSRVRLSALRRALPGVPRTQLDAALVALQRQHRLVLYRDDNTPALTAEDHEAALHVGDSPRHLVYLEA